MQSRETEPPAFPPPDPLPQQGKSWEPRGNTLFLPFTLARPRERLRACAHLSPNGCREARAGPPPKYPFLVLCHPERAGGCCRGIRPCSPGAGTGGSPSPKLCAVAAPTWDLSPQSEKLCGQRVLVPESGWPSPGLESWPPGFSAEQEPLFPGNGAPEAPFGPSSSSSPRCPAMLFRGRVGSGLIAHKWGSTCGYC